MGRAGDPGKHEAEPGDEDLRGDRVLGHEALDQRPPDTTPAEARRPEDDPPERIRAALRSSFPASFLPLRFLGEGLKLSESVLHVLW